MIINIKNLGPIKDLEIDTSKSLTIMCGPNNTGKTYVSYLIYTIYSGIISKPWIKYEYDDIIIKEYLSELKEKGEIHLHERLINQILSIMADLIKNKLMTIMFAISFENEEKLFKNLEIKLSLSKEQYNRILKGESESRMYIGNKTYTIKKELGIAKIKFITAVTEKNINNSELNDLPEKNIVNQLIYSFLISLAVEPVFNARMLTVERNSIYTFSKELSLNRSQFENTSGFHQSLQRYPLAIRDSLKIAEDLQQIQKTKSEFYSYAEDLERRLILGEIAITQNGNMEFIPDLKNKDSERLPFHMSSSVVKTMASLIMYLKYQAHIGDILIIDEPEMNLHPDNQIILARIFAEMVNKGINLVISTHSDYIIREFNNMIMAKEIIKKDKNTKSRRSLPYTSLQVLSSEDMEVIYYKLNKTSGDVKGEKVKITSYGFDIKSIDETIIKQTEMTHYLADIIMYGGEND